MPGADGFIVKEFYASYSKQQSNSISVICDVQAGVSLKPHRAADEGDFNDNWE